MNIVGRGRRHQSGNQREGIRAAITLIEGKTLLVLSVTMRRTEPRVSVGMMREAGRKMGRISFQKDEWD